MSEDAQIAVDAPRPVATPEVVPDVASGGAALTVLFAVTAFVGAGLLFVVQPLIAKLLLPSYGGSATVWSTSSLFFQVLLLLGYWYVHWSTARFGRRWQPRVHMPLLVLPLLVLPLALPTDAAPAADASPALWLLRTLVLVVGLPFAVVATTGPVLQKWYSWTGSRRADDPYFLFAASNLGSFGGLLAYPLLIEPHLSLADQRLWWSGGFALFVLLTGVCGVAAIRNGRRTTGADAAPSREPATALDRKQMWLWAGLAFLPSTLMLGVTSHLSTDVAAIPLLWVVPLAIYLATFVLAFSRQSRIPPLRPTQTAVAVGFAVVIASLVPGAIPIVVAVTANLVMLALVGYAAHARLAAVRPSADHLTTYYMVIAAGGAAGGLLNGLVAPLVFNRVLEYPLAMLAVPLLMLGVGGRPTWIGRMLRRNRVTAAGIVILVAVVAMSIRLGMWQSARHTVLVVVLFAIAVALGWWIARTPWAVVLALLVVFAATAVQETQGVLEQTRTFFGTYTATDEGDRHQLVHGTTIHGTQFRDSARREVPTTYYSRGGPLGDVFDRLDPDRFDNVAAVGLGTGTVAAYGREGQTMTFFEIDPEMVSMARDPQLFSYLSDSDAEVRTVVGDGRLRVAGQPSGSYDLMILDAFSSDSIPIHLLTTEAMRMYADRLAADGVLVVHISNRVFDLEPVVASAAEDLGWEAAVGSRGAVDPGSTGSVWVVLSPDASAVDRLRGLPDWAELDRERVVHWTDDYSSILAVLR